MRGQAAVAVIGGGIVGCSILYHLAARGWRDLVLLEQAELTAGVTWLAAGNVHRFDRPAAMIRLRDDSIRLYERLLRGREQSAGLGRTGGIVLATTEDRLLDLERRAGEASHLGLPHLLLNRREIRDHHPLIDLTGVLGGLYDPLCRHVDAYEMTHALAEAARHQGADIEERTEVLEIRAEPGGWRLVTSQGDLTAKILVNAAGPWANRIALMTGRELPLALIEHQYVITGPIKEVRSIEGHLPYIAEPDAGYYLRREGHGLLIGAFESEPRPWTLEGVPAGLGQTILQEDPARIAREVGAARRRLPCLADGTVKPPVNGPLVMTPDGRPLLGPVPGQPGLVVAAGFMDGIALAGGAGRALADWLVDGTPPFDLTPLDVARFGAFAGRGYVAAKALECYIEHDAVCYPRQERPAGRPLRRSPIHDRLAAKGAQFGFFYGWERPRWFAASAEERQGVADFKARPWAAAVDRECRGMARGIGLFDLTAMLAKHVIEGPGAAIALDALFASPLPAATGDVRDVLMLNRKGWILGRFSVLRVHENCFYLIGDAAAERIHQRWFEASLPATGLAYASTSVQYAVLGLAGPKARALLARVAAEEVGAEALPEGRALETEVAGAPAQIICQRTFGGAGFEIHMPLAYQGTVYEALDLSGRDLGLVDIGGFALDASRLEAGLGPKGRGSPSDLTPAEAGLEVLVDLDKGAFLGREALLQGTGEASVRRRVLVRVEDDSIRLDTGDDAPGIEVMGAEPVYHDGGVVGEVLHGGYAPNAGHTLARVLVPGPLALPETRLALDLMGKRWSATVLDPAGLLREGRISNV
jgi:dimethylglycine dehydrogenase